MKRILNTAVLNNVNKKINVSGWVHIRRDHGKIIFVDLRDRSGFLQLVFTPKNKPLYQLAETLKPEWVISVKGEVKKRPQGMENKNIPTGEVELVVDELEILNESKTTPFEINANNQEVKEEVRLKYRYLDLRTERAKKNIILRHKVIKYIRDFMTDKDFVEVETPILTRSTPEGARDFIVPSRFYPGKFYALPQSPQQYKQLLMAGGLERYFQIARCLRDEDPRADRQAEHTQLDIEMSFMEDKEEIMDILEELIIKIVAEFKPLTGKTLFKKPLPRLTYKEAMEKYKTNKPDLRKDKKSDELAFCWIIDWPLLEWSKEEKRWDPLHHMFTMPKKGHEKYLDTDPAKVISTQFDLVCNGYEICSGSLRIYKRELQEKMFDLIGLGRKKGREQFNHLLEAFDYGCPPHGGAAPGIDRLLMLLLGEENIREVIAFPKTGDNRDLMMDSPSEVEKQQLKELHIKIVKK